MSQPILLGEVSGPKPVPESGPDCDPSSSTRLADRSPLLRHLRASPVSLGILAAAAFVLATSACGWMAFNTAHDAFRRTLLDDLLRFAVLTSQRLDPEAHARIHDPDQLGTPEYEALMGPLRQAVGAVGPIRSIATIRVDADGQKRFVLDTGVPSRSTTVRPAHAAPGQPYLGTDSTLDRVLTSGRPAIDNRLETDRRGEYASAYVPIRRPSGQTECVLIVGMSTADYWARGASLRRGALYSSTIILLGGGVLGLMVTRFQQSRRDHLLQLTASERRYAMAVCATDDGIWDWDLTTGRIYVSSRIEQMIGRPHVDPFAVSALRRFFRILHPDDRQRVYRRLRAHLDGPEPYDITYRLRTVDGSYRWFHVRSTAERDQAGRALRIVGAISDITERRRLQQQLRFAARRDRLTRLPNRAVLLRRLGRALRRRDSEGRLYAVLFLDFDHFKLVNDCLGHDAGDALLVSIARRLRANLRIGDDVLCGADAPTAARLGGDEFVVLLEGLRVPEDALTVANRLQRVLAEPHQLGAYRVVSTASIGIVVGDAPYDRAENVLRDADTAMYEAKSTCRGQMSVFDSTMRERAARRLTIEQGLRSAIELDQLELLYQPVIDLRDGELVGMEAEIHWRHPELGPLDCDAFLPIAEDCGTILELADWTFDRLVAQIAAWEANPHSMSPVPLVGLRLPPRLLLVPGLAPILAARARQAGVMPGKIVLDFAESAVTSNPQVAAEVISALRVEGFRIAIDDFGTGQSSLGLLHELPFDAVRICLTQIDGPGGAVRAAVIRAVAAEGNQHGFAVVASGLRTHDQLDLARELGCRFGQGRVFTPPLTADEAARFAHQFAAIPTVLGPLEPAALTADDPPEAVAASAHPIRYVPGIATGGIG
jgi:diguanylate cyclase (GGDEF)-like protein/PAS domain S-box-containing protein